MWTHHTLWPQVTAGSRGKATATVPIPPLSSLGWETLIQSPLCSPLARIPGSVCALQPVCPASPLPWENVNKLFATTCNFVNLLSFTKISGCHQSGLFSAPWRLCCLHPCSQNQAEGLKTLIISNPLRLHHSTATNTKSDLFLNESQSKRKKERKTVQEKCKSHSCSFLNSKQHC